MRTALLVLSICFTGLAGAKERPENIQDVFGGEKIVQRIVAAKKLELCLRPFDDGPGKQEQSNTHGATPIRLRPDLVRLRNAEEQEESNTRESAAVRLTLAEVKRLRAALVDPSNYEFGAVVDCWRYRYARLKVEKDIVIDFCPLCGTIVVRRDGVVVGYGLFENGIPVLNDLLFRSFPDDRILSWMKQMDESQREKPNQSSQSPQAAGPRG